MASETSIQAAFTHRRAFTLIELLIVVVILGILADVVIPQFSNAAEDAKLSTLLEDLRITRVAISLYTLEHGGRHPCHAPGKTVDPDPDNFVLRLVGRTNPSGILSPVGQMGPYLFSFPQNPFITDPSQADKVQFGTGNPPVGTAGWYLNTNTLRLMPNSPGHDQL